MPVGANATSHFFELKPFGMPFDQGKDFGRKRTLTVVRQHYFSLTVAFQYRLQFNNLHTINEITVFPNFHEDSFSLL